MRVASVHFSNQMFVQFFKFFQVVCTFEMFVHNFHNFCEHDMAWLICFTYCFAIFVLWSIVQAKQQSRAASKAANQQKAKADLVKLGGGARREIGGRRPVSYLDPVEIICIVICRDYLLRSVVDIIC